MSQSPFELHYDPYKGFLLIVNVTFNRRAYDFTINSQIYKEQIVKAVEEKWSNIYTVNTNLREAARLFLIKYSRFDSLSNFHQASVPFKVIIKTDPLSGVYSNRLVYLMRFFSRKPRPIPIFLKKARIFPSHVASGFFRRLWGFLRYGRIMTIGLNWSRNFPGFAVINQYSTLSQLSSISAHEFGHLFGLDDAYAAWYRLYHPAAGTTQYMMHYNRQVNSNEIAMLIKAYATNRMQFFPIKWNWQDIKIGFKKELNYYQKKIRELRIKML